MKTALKSLLGENIISKIRTLFPSKVQREITRAVKEDATGRSRFYGSFVSKGDICFDVGANLGNRIAPLLLLGCSVVAVEPQEVCYKYLQKKFGSKIKLVTKGLGKTDSVQKFYLSNGPVLSSFSEEWIDAVKSTRSQEYNWDNSVDVEMTTADKLIAQYGLPSFIKIDVEGYELEVLKGLSYAIKMISFEYTVPQQAEKPAQCIDRILSVNKNIECNYCVAETMEFASHKWLTAEEMKQFIATDEFIETSWGDIYVRTKK